MDNTDFFTFQRLIHGQLLLLLRNVFSITSHEGLESRGQDLRLWSVGEGQVDVTLMFYINCRKRKEYFRATCKYPTFFENVVFSVIGMLPKGL